MIVEVFFNAGTVTRDAMFATNNRTRFGNVSAISLNVSSHVLPFADICATSCMVHTPYIQPFQKTE